MYVRMYVHVHKRNGSLLFAGSPPVIKVQPRDVRGAEPKTSFVIELEAEGRAPLCFQWERKPLVPLANAATGTYIHTYVYIIVKARKGLLYMKYSTRRAGSRGQGKAKCCYSIVTQDPQAQYLYFTYVQHEPSML